MSTGQIFFVAGIAGMIATVVVAIVVFRSLRQQEKKIKEQIWKEYR